MATLQESMESMKGVGEKHKYALASFLERNQLRGAKAMDEVLYGEDGFVARAKALDDTLDDHGREMLTKITDLFKESVGKGASETRDILTKMKVLQETLGKSTDEQSNQLSELIRGGGIQALEKQGSLFNVTKDIVRGKVAGFKDKMIRKIPFVGGLAADVLGERKRRKRLAADQKSELEASGIEASGIEPSGTEEPKEEKGPGGLSKLASETTSLEEKVRGFVGLRRKTPEEKLLVKIHKLLLTRLPRKDGGAKLEERETLLEKTKSKVGGFLGKLSGRNKEGGGLGGMLGGILPKILAVSGLGALIGGGISAFIGFLMPIIGGIMAAAPFIAIAAGAAGLIMLAMNWDETTNFLRDKLGVAKDQKEALELADISANKVLATETASGEYFDTAMKTSEGKALFRNMDTGEIEQLSKEQVATLEKSGEMGAYSGIKDTSRGGASIKFKEGEDLESLKSGSLSFEESKKAIGRSELKGDKKEYKDLLTQVVGADKEFRSAYKREILHSDNWESQFNTWGDRWAGVFKNVVFDIEMRERNGMITKTQADKLYSMSPLFDRGWSSDDYTFDQPWMLGEQVGELNTPVGTFEGKNWEHSEVDEIPQPWRNDPEAGKLYLHQGGLIKRRNVPAVLNQNEVVIPLSSAMVPQTGTLSEGAKLLIQTLMGNALFKGTEPTMGGGGGGAVIAPITSNSVISNTDNIFSGTPSTRNSEPSFREMQRLLYA